ncbi:MAG: helix-turn-helix transcriptional regulator [Anaerolineae bacterium]|nr:helix-turn-helix transcriptional regulator [Anaerolineae bacterium]
MRELARFFKALGDETWLRLVSLLAQQEPGRALCVGRLARELGVTDSAVFQNLRVLKDLGLVHVQRGGYRLHCLLDSERLAVYQDLVRERLGEDFVVRERDQPVQEGGEEHVLS